MTEFSIRVFGRQRSRVAALLLFMLTICALGAVAATHTPAAAPPDPNHGRADVHRWAGRADANTSFAASSRRPTPS